jgi:uridylate kinase
MLFQLKRFTAVMLKISGEILAGPQGYGFDDEVIENPTDEIIKVPKRL